MKEEYIKAVTEALNVTKEDEKAVVKSINEAFEVGKRQGKEESEIIEKLGSPAEFAEKITEGTGKKIKIDKKDLIFICITLAFAGISFIIYGATNMDPTFKNVKFYGFKLPGVFLCLGIFSMLLSCVYYYRSKSNNK